MPRFGEMKPPWRIQTFPAAGLARKATSRCAAGEDVSITATSPPTSIGAAFSARTPGKLKKRASEPLLVCGRKLLTKSPSKTMAALGCGPKTCSTELGKVVRDEPARDPETAGFPMI